MKICKLCKKEKELICFGFNKYEKDGHNQRCKECLSIIRKKKQLSPISKTIKRCFSCKKEKEVVFFRKNKASLDGLNIYCKKCSKNF